jgi:hypothetical protein
MITWHAAYLGIIPDHYYLSLGGHAFGFNGNNDARYRNVVFR